MPPWLPPAIEAFGTIIALSAFAYQVYRARFNQSVDLLLKFEAAFFGQDMRDQRSKAARHMRRTPPDFTEAEDVIDFFETVALMSRKGALDRYMVWHTFFYWLDRYYEVTKSYIEQRRKVDPTIWQDIGPLVERLRKLQKREAKLKSLAPGPTPEELEHFLSEEQSEGTPSS